MKTQLLIPVRILYLLAIFGCVFSVVTVSFNMEFLHLPFGGNNILGLMALFCNFIVSFVLIVDVFRNNLDGKYLWTLGFLFPGGIIALFYFAKREKSLDSK